MKYPSLIILFLFLLLEIHAQNIIRMNPPQSFRKYIPPGNYSGITHMGNDLYAVVSDKSVYDGFFVFRLEIDSVTGKIKKAENLYFRASVLQNRDAEGIAWIPETKTLLIVGEKDSRIIEYDSLCSQTGREISLEYVCNNYGYESLSYNANTGLLWTCTENSIPHDKIFLHNDTSSFIRLQSFDKNLKPVAQYLYELDRPISSKTYKYYAHGVSELLALDNGALLVLEREFAVPKVKTGAYVLCKLYKVEPYKEYSFSIKEPLSRHVKKISKILIGQWKTKLNLFNYNIANYEGMCLGPKLADGSRVIIMIADSQDRKGGILRDWFRTIVISE